MAGRLLALGLLAGCSFEHGSLTVDASARDGDNQGISDGKQPDAPSKLIDAPAVAGSISITVATLGSADLDLTAEGTTDWAHWGYGGVSGFTRKQGGTAISNLAAAPDVSFTGAPFTASWTNGTPQATASMTSSGVGVHQGSNAQFTVAAGTAPHTLRLYVGAQTASARLDVTLSDSSAMVAPQTKSSTTTTTNYQYTIVYNAATDGQQLTVRWSDTNDAGNPTQSFAALLEATLQ